MRRMEAKFHTSSLTSLPVIVCLDSTELPKLLSLLLSAPRLKPLHSPLPSQD